MDPSVNLDGCGEEKNLMRPSGFEPITVQLLARCYAFPAPHGQVSYVLIACDVDISHYSMSLQREREARGGAVGGGTALLAGRSQVRFRIVSLEFFINIILPWSRLSL